MCLINSTTSINSSFKHHGITSVENYNKRDLKWKSKTCATNEQQLFLDSTYEPEEIIDEISIRLIKSNNGSAAVTKLEYRKGTPYIQEQRHRKFGRCYTIQPGTTMKKLGIYYMTLKL